MKAGNKAFQRVLQIVVVFNLLTKEDVVVFGSFAKGPDVILPPIIQFRAIPSFQGATLEVVGIDRWGRIKSEISWN